MIQRSVPGFVVALIVAVLGASFCIALEPPTKEQLEKYRRDGSLSRRVAEARSLGNHRMAPWLVERFRQSSGRLGPKSAASTKGLPTTGQSRVFALLIDFRDHEGQNARSAFQSRLFGSGLASAFPYESLRSYYQRSSYGQLDIQGSTLGWYRVPHDRQHVSETDGGRESLIRDAIEHFDEEGHDFSQYDNDGNGEIDYFLVFWAGPHGEWNEFWWGYQVFYQDSSFVVDGKRLGAYSWQWEAWEVGDPFTPRVAIHETGHALGLPDYYDYDDSVGPDGGLGDLDMMDGSTGDHNCFSKYVLGWINPEVMNEGAQDFALMPSDEEPDAAIFMHGNPQTDPFGEYFMVQHRRREGNDEDLPNQGLLIWHVDARLDIYGSFRYDNSYTDHKLIRLMESDGLEEIEQDLGGDADDYYVAGDIFNSQTTPNSNRHDGVPTNLAIDEIRQGGSDITFGADLGSGCALFCEVAPPEASWPEHRTSFVGTVDSANCQGTAATEWWIDGVTVVDDLSVVRSFSDPGTYEWSLEGTLGDSRCSSAGSVLVCQDERCWAWRKETPMSGERLVHAAQTLDDGRVLVAGGSARPEIYDPVTQTWSPTGPISGFFMYAKNVLLQDGRVLVVGATPGDPVSAEIYDPVTDTWSVTDGLNSRRMNHSAIGLNDGRVLVAGGLFPTADGGQRNVVSIEVYDPSTQEWKWVANMAEPAILPGLSLLPDGRVLITETQAVEIFDPSTDDVSDAAEMLHERQYHVSVALDDGTVLVAGGFYSPNGEIYDPQSNSWTATQMMNGFRLMPEVSVNSMGRVFLFGGFDRNSNVIDTVEVFDPSDGSWTAVAPMSRPRLGHRASRLTSGAVLVTGGMKTLADQFFSASRSVEIFKAPVVDVAPRLSGRRVTPGN